MRLNTDDLVWLLEEIAHAVERHAALPPALAELAETEPDTRAGRTVTLLSKSVGDGASLAQAIETQPGVFPQGLSASIEAGERSNQLPATLRGLAQSYATEAGLRADATNALVYPILIALMCFVGVVFFKHTILPSFMDMYEDLHITLPEMTKELPFITGTGVILMLFLPTFVMVIFYVWPALGLPPSVVLDRIRIRTPLLGRILRQKILARWCGTAAALAEAGVPEGEFIRLAGESTGNARVMEISEQIAFDVERGDELAEVLEEYYLFPEVLVWMVHMASEAGGHRHVWRVAQQTYAAEAERTAVITSTGMSVAFAGLAMGIVGFTVIAVFLPLVELMNKMG